ncbi:hypothetical protein niasHT_017283 [Heterodera trifolii]|uniref:Uncharacterized protein n=1 Tax=Heterodera trifolii TaxID=157864 RepID=A0ABD2LGV5_9BILA
MIKQRGRDRRLRKRYTNKRRSREDKAEEEQAEAAKAAALNNKMGLKLGWGGGDTVRGGGGPISWPIPLLISECRQKRGGGGGQGTEAQGGLSSYEKSRKCESVGRENGFIFPILPMNGPLLPPGWEKLLHLLLSTMRTKRKRQRKMFSSLLCGRFLSFSAPKSLSHKFR